MEWFHVRGRFTSGKSQNFMVLLAGLLVSLFAGILVTSTSVLAADATWNNSKLDYQNQTYSPINDRVLLESLELENAERVYGAHTQSANQSQFRTISFPEGSDMQTAETAQYAVFDYTPPDTYELVSSSSITTEPAGDNYRGLESGTSCAIGAIGWIVCPTANFLAWGMDSIYEVLAQFLVAQPLNVSDSKSGLYMAWDIMRGIANAVFIISFMIIIYSHITSMGVSNYGIKKMLPRLVVAALLVNLSFYICAIAIDLSNILGQAVQDMFISIRNTITTVGGGAQVMPTWEAITAFVLSAGTIGAGLATFAFTYGGSVGAATIMLLPLLLGLLITIIVVLLVLAARQALIVILTIISPLAFVAYLLPGTEKWFDKWKDLFITMLIFFPAFSAVFGGSQLAAAAIIQNADSIVMLILGLGVQVAPLALAPLILKLSGGLLNRFAGVVNNPAKGVLDRTKNFAKEESSYRANRARSKKDTRNPLARMGQRAYHMQHRRKERIENYQKKADALYEASEGHAQLDKQRREIEHDKQLVDKQLELNWNTHLKVDTKAMEEDLKLRVLVDKTELSKLELDNRYEEAKAGHHPAGFVGPMRANDPMLGILDNAKSTTEHLAAQGLRKNNAQRVLNQQLAENMLANTQLQKEAGGIYGNLGSDAAVASAISTMRSEYGKSVEEGRQIVKHFNLSSDQRQQHALGQAVTVTDSAGNSRTFDTSNTFTREAVIEDQIAVGTVNQVKEIVQASGGTLSEYKTTISEAIAKSGVKGKAPYMGGKLIDDIAKGSIASEDHLLGYIQDWIADGKYRDEDIAITDPDGLKLLMKAARSSTAQMSPGLRTQLASGLAGLSVKAKTVLKHEDLKGHVSKKAQPLMEKISKGDFTP